MAYGNILGYEPAPQPGAYNFKQANGQSVLLSGPPAESLKAKLDASSGLAGQRTAGPGGGAPADMVDQPPSPEPLMSVAPPQVDQAPPAMSAAPAASAMPNEGQLATPNTPPPLAAGPQFRVTPTGAPAEGVPGAIAAPPPGQQSSPYVVNGVNTGIVQGPDGRLYKHMAGSAPVTQAQLAAKAATGIATPHSASDTVAGGFDPSKEYLDERQRLADEKGAIIDKTAEVEHANATREQMLADQQAKNAANLQAEEQGRADAIAQRLQKDEQTKDRLMQDYGNAKVDPKRLFSGPGSGGRSILAVLAAGLGAAGQGMFAVANRPGQPNQGMQAVNMAIDRDISAQENEIKIKGQMADNALAQFQRTGLSAEQSRAALRATQLQWANAQAQQAAAQTKGSLVDVNAANMHNSLSGALNDANEDYRQKSLGLHTKQVASQIVYPHAGSAGGLVALTPDEAMKTGERAVETGGKVATTAKTIADIRKEEAATGKPKGNAALGSAIDNLDLAAGEIGLTPDEKGVYSGDAAAVMRSGGLGTSEQVRKFHNALRAAAPEVLKAQGERVTPQAIESWMDNAKSMSGDQVKQFLVAQKRALSVRELNERKYGTPAPQAMPAPEPGETE